MQISLEIGKMGLISMMERIKNLAKNLNRLVWKISFSISRDSKTNKENLHENDSANNSRRSSLTGNTRYVTFIIFQIEVKNFKK